MKTRSHCSSIIASAQSISSSNGPPRKRRKFAPLAAPVVPGRGGRQQLEETPTRMAKICTVAAAAGHTGSFAPTYVEEPPPHTLILGTQPSSNSLEKNWYFGSNENAFWYVA